MDKNVGGVVGLNDGNMTSLYNESIVMGKDNVGGLVGRNEKDAGLSNLSNALAAEINGQKFVGGIAGTNAGDITGSSNLVNEGKIVGETYVGGIAGKNTGKINGSEGAGGDGAGLTNKATVSGNKYVGGVAGQNAQGGTITNTNSAADLEAITITVKGENGQDMELAPQYFGGVAGQNAGEINGATNSGELEVENATFVGGITGQNTNTGTFIGTLRNDGVVTGKSQVGGIAGENLNGSVLDNDNANDRLVIVNTEKVTANEGGAAGIFYTNTGNINNVEIRNEGEIDGGTGAQASGGLFGENSGKITNSKLSNSGTVRGGSNVGGLIGDNSGDVETSILINTVDGVVTGTGTNVGGLIGKNTGTITGGRAEADNGMKLKYYAYQIVNNGTVTGASNVGGLIGNNADESSQPDGKKGSLTAGYNTGEVTATGENAGGIAGVNAGTIDKVFNTVMTLDENNNVVDGAISGKTNAGGIVGSNAGTLKNAYNTTGVSTTDANGVKGNIAGSNEGSVENVYATNDASGKLIGDDGEVTNGYNFAADDDNAKKSESYDGFVFSTSSDDDLTWKIYDGFNTPLLKVFLTQAEYTGDKEFTYNGGDQGLSKDTVTAGDGLAAYDKDNSLLQNFVNKNANSSEYVIWSSQITAKNETDGDSTTFNPNILGYDIDASYKINKARLNVTLDDVSRTYGDKTITNSTTGDGLHPANGYGYSYTVDNGELTNTMREELKNLTFAQRTDGAVDGVDEDNGQKTHDAGGYTWTADFSLDNSLSGNYEFVKDDGTAPDTLTGVEGNSKVNKATLTVTLDDVERTYGNAEITNGSYGIKGGFARINGDNYSVDDFEVAVVEGSDEALADGTTDGKVTKDAGGNYTWTGIVTGKDSDGKINKNYDIVVANESKGNSIVNKADLTITADDKTTKPGEAPAYTGTTPDELKGQLVNGDVLNGFDYTFGIDNEELLNTLGSYEDVIGLFVNGTFYGGTYESWGTLNEVFKNYNVIFNPGTLTVSDYTAPTVVEPPVTAYLNYGHLHQDGWDRLRNFRERKAELYFHEGGMEYAEEM